MNTAPPRRGWMEPWFRLVPHPSLLVLAGLAWLGGHGVDLALGFLAVLLHELAHAGVALGYGLEVERIELWPFGGMARIPGLAGQDPYIESMVALAGPLESLALAAVLKLAAGGLPLDGGLVDRFVTLNLILGLGNLAPVAPLDGGHLARVYLAGRIGYRAAEDRVAAAGRWAAAGLLGSALVAAAFGRLWLEPAVFAGFLYWGAGRDRHQAVYWAMRDLELRAVEFRRRPVWPLEDFAVLGEVPAGLVVRAMRPRRFHRVAVLDSELRLLGTLYERELLEGIRRFGPALPVGELVSPPR